MAKISADSIRQSLDLFRSEKAHSQRFLQYIERPDVSMWEGAGTEPMQDVTADLIKEHRQRIERADRLIQFYEDQLKLG
ncbi:hypothetical protein [Dongia sp.]|uniref:hypothetical protein n=1 Tax=Dongia sp. TaxID=1977262 RepID=UPI0035B1A01B